MAPAFGSTKQAAAFALLLALLLALPAIIPAQWLPAREQSFETESWGAGPYPWFHQEIFKDKSDIDIAFMGSSHMLRGIDTPYVQDELSKQLGHPATVRSIVWGGAGFDALYFLAKALLDHRKVHYLVFYDEVTVGNNRNIQGTAWFRWKQDKADLAGLPWQEKARFYLVSLLSMPRDLLGFIHPNHPADLSPKISHEQEVILHAPNPGTRLGSMRAEVGYNNDPYSYSFDPFVRFVPPIDDKPNEVEVYSNEKKGGFRFGSGPILRWEDHFLRKLGDLARAHGTQLIMLHLPTTSELHSPVINERIYWPEIIHTDVTMVGIQPAIFFQNMSDSDMVKLYSDGTHLNRNGMEYFTSLVTPTLLRIYGTRKYF
jgi:hypothetical protein